MVRSVWLRFIYLVAAGGYHLALRRPVTAHGYILSAKIIWWLYGPMWGRGCGRVTA